MVLVVHSQSFKMITPVTVLVALIFSSTTDAASVIGKKIEMIDNNNATVNVVLNSTLFDCSTGGRKHQRLDLTSDPTAVATAGVYSCECIQWYINCQ